VDDELLTAANLQKPLVEVRETEVEEPSGMLEKKLQGKQRIIYDGQHRDRCLVEIALAIGKLHRLLSSVQFVLMPEDFAGEIAPLLRDPDLRCIYRVLGKNDFDAGPEQSATIYKLPGRQVIVRTGAVPEDASIMVEVWIGRARLLWNSVWQPVSSRTIYLEKVS
jgi:hypothetical protein